MLLKNNEDNYVACPICNVSLKEKNLLKHKRRKHSEAGQTKKAETRAKKDFDRVNRKKLAPLPSLKLMNATQRRRYLDSLDRPDRDWSSDIMDSGRVYTGGGYGLGRNRKH